MLPLGYSSNLHAAETVDDIIARVVPFAAAVRERLGWERMGIDLKLGLAALDHRQGANLTALRKALDAAHLSAHTLNGFPLQPFHQSRVKEQAYLPDWSDPERGRASIGLLHAALALSDEPLVTISTVPGSYRPFGSVRNDPRIIASALGCWAAAAAVIHRERNRTAVLCLEPEPWCFLETSWDVAAFWRGALAEHGVAAAARILGGESEGRNAVAQHLGICFDTCHLSLAFEDQRLAADRMAAAGVRIAKCQLSAAPQVRNPHRDQQGLGAFRALAEPRYLHQTAAHSAAGSISKVKDLDELDRCLARIPDADMVRSHFHIPVFREPTEHGLSTTIGESLEGLRACVAHGCSHVAVETYTWSILATDERDIAAGTTRELAWLEKNIAEISA